MTKIMIEDPTNPIGIDSIYVDLGKGVDESIDWVALDCRTIMPKKKGGKTMVRLKSWKAYVNPLVIRELEEMHRRDVSEFWLKVSAISGFFMFMYWGAWGRV